VPSTTVNGTGSLVYNKNGNTIFTKGTDSTVTVYLSTTLQTNDGVGDPENPVTNAVQFATFGPPIAGMITIS
jgi:hypothetical protein